jgi:hypothetical protein
MNTKYNAIQYLIIDGLSQYTGTDYLIHLVREILLDGVDDEDYVQAKVDALFTYYNTFEVMSHLLTNWYLTKEGPEVFNEYPLQFTNLVDYLMTGNDVFINHIKIIQQEKLRRLESILNG